MGKVFTRDEIRDRLNGQVAGNSPIVAAGPASGLAAKCSALGGADLIIHSTTAVSRSMGFPTRAIEDFHGDRSLRIHETFFEIIPDTPLIAGLDAADIFSLDHERLVGRFIAAGTSGVCNLPASQMFGDAFRTGAGATPRHGLHMELNLLQTAHDAGLFTVGYAFYADDALKMLDVGVDMIIATCGHTQGGVDGYPEQPLDVALDKISKVATAVKQQNADIFVLGHGGPFNAPESTPSLYAGAPVDGIYACSALDRIPIQNVVTQVVREYKTPLAEVRAS